MGGAVAVFGRPLFPRFGEVSVLLVFQISMVESTALHISRRIVKAFALAFGRNQKSALGFFAELSLVIW